jgi:hypothetical protein
MLRRVVMLVVPGCIGPGKLSWFLSTLALEVSLRGFCNFFKRLTLSSNVLDFDQILSSRRSLQIWSLCSCARFGDVQASRRDLQGFHEVCVCDTGTMIDAVLTCFVETQTCRFKRNCKWFCHKSIYFCTLSACWHRTIHQVLDSFADNSPSPRSATSPTICCSSSTCSWWRLPLSVSSSRRKCYGTCSLKHCKIPAISCSKSCV